jgi:alpha-tubulin suppressor-like RCC1 family protein
MQTIDLGKIKIRWRGAYSPTTSYERDDAVSWGGSSYICIASVTGTPPQPAGNSYWDIMASGTDQLTTQGDILIQGQQGPTRLPAGDSGAVLTTRGTGDDPVWQVSSSQQGTSVSDLPVSYGIGGYEFLGVIMADHTQRVWGALSLGRGGVGPQGSNWRVPVMPNFPKVDSHIEKWAIHSYNNLCLMSDGSLYAWGQNNSGCFGLDHSAYVLVPTRLEFFDAFDVKDVLITPNAMFVLTHDGKLFSCGYNTYGELADGTYVNRIVPYQLSKDDWVRIYISGGDYNSVFAIDSSGDLYAWGYNGGYLLGNGDTSSRNSPIKVNLPSPVLSVSSTMHTSYQSASHVGHTLALLTNGEVYGWGYNTFGQLGDATTSTGTTPQRIIALGNDNVSVHAAGGYSGFSVVEKADGTIRTFGNNNHRQLGTGSYSNQSSPQTPAGISGHGGIRQILAMGYYGYGHVMVLFNDGEVKAWGANYFGELAQASENDTIAEPSTIHFMKHKPIKLFATQMQATVASTSRYGSSFLILTQEGHCYVTGHGDLVPFGAGMAAHVPHLIHF